MQVTDWTFDIVFFVVASVPALRGRSFCWELIASPPPCRNPESPWDQDAGTSRQGTNQVSKRCDSDRLPLPKRWWFPKIEVPTCAIYHTSDIFGLSQKYSKPGTSQLLGYHPLPAFLGNSPLPLISGSVPRMLPRGRSLAFQAGAGKAQHLMQMIKHISHWKWWFSIVMFVISGGMEMVMRFGEIPNLSGWWFQTWLWWLPYMGCHPNPIDELHHFSRWLLHHQPVINDYPYAKHGAGIWIPTFARTKSPSFVGKYTIHWAYGLSYFIVCHHISQIHDMYPPSSLECIEANKFTSIWICTWTFEGMQHHDRWPFA